MTTPSSDFPEKIALIEIPSKFRKIHNKKSLVYVFICALVVITSGVVAYFFASAWGYVLAYVCVVIAGDALLKLQHEAMHGVLVSNTKLNAWLGKFISALMGTRYYDAITIHMRHHTRLGHDEDPNLYWYDEKNNVPIFMLKQLLGAKLWMFVSRTIMVLIRSFVHKGEVKFKTNTSLDSAPVVVNKARAIDDLAALVVVQATLFILIAYFTAWWVYLIFVVLPPSTLGSLFESVRSFSEHARYAGGRKAEVAERRRLYLVLSSPLERFALSQFGFHVHHLHHLYPTVPVFNLPGLHLWMLENFKEYGRLFIVRKSYVGTLYCYISKQSLE